VRQGFLRRLKRGRRSWRENGSRTSTFAKLIAPSFIVRSIQFLDMVFYSSSSIIGLLGIPISNFV